MTRTFLSAAAIAATIALTPFAAAAQGLQVEVRPSGPPAWLDPPNVVAPGSSESWGSRVVQQQMVLRTHSGFISEPDRYGTYLLPERREQGTLPPFIAFED